MLSMLNKHILVQVVPTGAALGIGSTVGLDSTVVPLSLFVPIPALVSEICRQIYTTTHINHAVLRCDPSSETSGIILTRGYLVTSYQTPGSDERREGNPPYAQRRTGQAQQ